MNAALDLIKPGPTPGSFVLAAARFVCARPAPNRAISLVVQRVVGNMLFVQIVPEMPSFLNFRLTRKMIISEKIDEFAELVAVLNRHFQDHSIKIEIKVNGQWQASKRLLTSFH